MTGEACFFFPLFRRVLRLVGDRVLLGERNAQSMTSLARR